MNFLEERILRDGIVREGNVLKVDSFLNHQMDVELLDEIGREFYRRFADSGVTKILTIEASGIALDTVTGGAVVDGARQTGTEGIFACGNVLHVHDLVDYVSEEAVIVGESAVRYIKGETQHGMALKLVTDGKIRYTVPQKITSAENTKVYFRVANVYRDVKIVVKDGDKVLLEKKKQKVAPGEMETVLLTEKLLSALDKDSTLTFALEEVK